MSPQHPASAATRGESAVQDSAAEDALSQASQCLLMPVGPEWYLLDMRWLHEVVSEPLVSALPTAPSTIMGLFNMRGEIIPLFDTGSLLGLAPIGTALFALVVETELGAAGLAASGAPESVALGEPIGNSDMPGAISVHAFGDRIATLLDLDVLFASSRIGDSRP